MKCRGVYRKWTDNGYIEPYNALVSKKAKYRRQAKKGLRRRERRLAENPMDLVYDIESRWYHTLDVIVHGDGYDYWVYDDLMEDWDEDFNNYGIDSWKYYFDWDCNEPWEELSEIDNWWDFAYNGISMKDVRGIL